MNDVSLKDYLEMNHLTLIMTSNNYYLLDYVSGCSVSGDDLQVNFEAIKNKLESSDNVSSQNNVICDEPEEIVSFIFSSSMLDISGLFYSGAVGGANNKKKKKKIQ